MTRSSLPQLTLRFRGVRGSIPSPGKETARYGGNTSCVELRYGSDVLILDAGSGIRSLGDDLLKEFGSRPLTANLLISHTHWDHIQGFPFFAPLYSPQHRVHVFEASGNCSRLERALRNQMQSMHFPIGLDQMRGLSRIEELDAGVTHLGRFTVSTHATNHPGGCAAFRISVPGAALVYLPDHEPYQSVTIANVSDVSNDSRQEALLDYIRGVDLLIVDTQYTTAEYENRLGWGHGCIPDSVQLAIDAGARRLFLFHHDPGHDDEQIDRMVEGGRAIAAGSPLQIEAASEGEAFRVNRSRSEVDFASPLPRETIYAFA